MYWIVFLKWGLLKIEILLKSKILFPQTLAELYFNQIYLECEL